MTLRHGIAAALLLVAGVGWAVNPPKVAAGRKREVAAAAAALSVGVLAAGVRAARAGESA